MTEAYQKKAAARAKRAFELLKSGMEPEKVVKECGYVDVSSMLWYLRERGFRFTSGELQEKQEGAFAPTSGEEVPMDVSYKDTPFCTGEELLEASVNAVARHRLVKKALNSGANEEYVASAFGYKSVSRMKAAIKPREGKKAEDVKVDPPMLDGSAIKFTAIKFGSLTAQCWRGTFFKFSLTEPGDECALPAGHVQAELLHQGELSDLVDDVVAGGVLPLEIAARTYERYADLLRAAADEMESAARVFGGYGSK